MESAAAVPKAHLPPLPLKYRVVKVKYRELVEKLVRIYQTYACSLSEKEQRDFCRMVKSGEYEQNQAADRTITCHGAYRKMFLPHAEGCLKDAVTFERWALLATVYFRPWPRAPAGLSRVAKVVSLLGIQRQDCFKQYQSYHETNLERLRLPDADELASEINFTPIFLTSPNTASLSDNTAALPSSALSTAATKPARPEKSVEQLGDFNAEELCEFLKNLDAKGKDCEPTPAVASREAGVIAMNVSGLTFVERPTASVARPAREEKLKSPKRRLSSSPDGLWRSPTKKQSISSPSPAAAHPRGIDRASTGKVFVEQIDTFMVTIPARIEQIQAQLDSHKCGVAAEASQAPTMDRRAAASDALQDTNRQLAQLKLQLEDLKASHGAMTTHIVTQAREAAVAAAEQQTRTAIRQEVEAQTARLRADLAAATEAQQKSAETAKQSRARLRTSLAALEAEVRSHADLLRQAEADAAMRESSDDGTKVRDAVLSPPPAATTTALLEHVRKIVDSHLPGALRRILQLHAQDKEDMALKK